GCRLLLRWQGRRCSIAIATPLATAFGSLQERERTLEHAALLCGERFERLRPDANFRVVNVAEAGAGRNQVAEDHVFLETDQVIGPPGERCFREHLRRLLEARCRN